MDGRLRQHQRPNYIRQPFWLRPYWWLWTGGCGLLIVVLGIGAPVLCIVHCALLDGGHVHMYQASSLVTTGQACVVGAPLPTDQHIPLQAIFPAILAGALGMVRWPISYSPAMRALLRLQPWLASAAVPPPRLYS